MIKIFCFVLLVCGLVGGVLMVIVVLVVLVCVVMVELVFYVEECVIFGWVEVICVVDICVCIEGVIVQCYFQDGQYVIEGDLLFIFDDVQFCVVLVLVQVELKSVEVLLCQLQQLFICYEWFINNYFISCNDVDMVWMQCDVVVVVVQQVKVCVEVQQIVFSYIQIVVLVIGCVGYSVFYVGMLVNLFSGVLVDIVQLDLVWVLFVFDEVVFFSKIGQYVDIYVLKQVWLVQIEVDGKWCDGVLIFIDNWIDVCIGSVVVWVEFVNLQYCLLLGGSVMILFCLQELLL